MIRGLERLARFVNKALMTVSGAAMLAIMLLSVANVSMRLLGRAGVGPSGLPGAHELQGYVGALLVAFALAHTQERKRHVRVDLIARALPRKVNLSIDLFKYLLKLVFCVFLVVFFVDKALSLRASGEVSETVKIPFYPFVLCVGLGFAVMALTLLVDFLTTIERWREPPPEPTAPEMEDGIEEDIPVS